jgi:hypothetical protein
MTTVLDRSPTGHGFGYFGNVPHLRRQVARHLVYGVGKVFPDATHTWYKGLSAEFTVRTYFPRHPVTSEAKPRS